VRRLIGLAGVAMILLAACGGTDRPEGAVENWLIALNQGKAGEPHTYAPADVTNSVLPNWAQCDPGSLDVIEVGTHAAGKSGEALVPYRIEYASDLSSCETTEHATAPKEGTAVVRRAEGGWRVTSLQTRSTTGALLVPSEGGEAIGTAPASAWLAALGISVLLMVLVALLIRLTPEPAPLPREQQVPR